MVQRIAFCRGLELTLWPNKLKYPRVLSLRNKVEMRTTLEVANKSCQPNKLKIMVWQLIATQIAQLN
jgi:hypothetical protein